MTAEQSPHRRGDDGFTLPEVLIVVVLLGILMPVLAMTFSVVVRTNPTSSDRADDSRSLLNLTNWVSQDVSSTAEDGFFIGASAPSGGCLASSLPTSSINLLELQWSEGSKRFVANYRWVSSGASKGRIFRYSCLQGDPAVELRMTAELNEVTSGQFGRAPVEITPTPTTRANGLPGIKGVQFVVLIFDEYGVQRELLSLDATTTNVVTTLPGSGGGSGNTNQAPSAADLSVTITPPATLIETIQATDPDGDILFTTFPNGVPAGWNLRATELTIEITPDPAAAPGLYAIDYRVTDPTGATADAKLNVTIAVVTPNQPPVASALSLNATKGLPSVGTLVFSDPEGETLVPVLNPADIPIDWTATVSGNQVTVTPSASASGTTVIRYSVTDSAGATTTSQITVNVCTVSLVSVTPASQTVGVKGNGDLLSDVVVQISSNGACSALVLGFLPNTSPVESTESFNAAEIVTIRTNSATWTRPGNGQTRVVALNVRQGANGPIQLSLNLTTTR